jgi:hypothetical protein
MGGQTKSREARGDCMKRRRKWSPEAKARIIAATREPGAIVAQIAQAEGVPPGLVYKWRLSSPVALDTPTTTPVSAPPADKPKVHRVSFGLTESPVEVTAQLGPDQCLESLTARTGDGKGEVFIRVPIGPPLKATAPPRHATDELAVMANGVLHTVTTRRTSEDLAEVCLRFVCGGVPVEVSHIRGPLLEEALRRVMDERKKLGHGGVRVNACPAAPSRRSPRLAMAGDGKLADGSRPAATRLALELPHAPRNFRPHH